MANQQISYTTRDFQGIRQELINYVKQYYPDLINNFNDASVFSVLMDLNAAVAFIRQSVKIPVIPGLPFGHTPMKATLPIGAKVGIATEDGMAHLVLEEHPEDF